MESEVWKNLQLISAKNWSFIWHFIEEMINNLQTILMKFRVKNRLDTQQNDTYKYYSRTFFLVNQLNSDELQSLQLFVLNLSSWDLKPIFPSKLVGKNVDSAQLPWDSAPFNKLAAFGSALLRTVEKHEAFKVLKGRCFFFDGKWW